MTICRFSNDAVYGMSTGWLSGGELSINSGDGAKLDITSGTGVIVDVTDPNNITRKFVSWDAFDAVTLEFIATNAASFIAVDEDGALRQSNVFPVKGDLRDLIQLGGQTHGDNVSITVVSNFLPAPAFQYGPSLTDLTIALGVINISGNEFGGSSVSGLKVTKTVGSIFDFGLNLKNSPAISPNNKTTPALNEPVMIFVWRDGSGGFNSAVRDDLEAGVYDNNNGGTTNPTDTLGPSKWTNLKIKYSPDLEEAFMEWGQTLYNNSDDAVAGINLDTFASDPSLAGVPVRGYLSIRGGASDLTDIADAVFTNGNKFGLV